MFRFPSFDLGCTIMHVFWNPGIAYVEEEGGGVYMVNIKTVEYNIKAQKLVCPLLQSY